MSNLPSHKEKIVEKWKNSSLATMFNGGEIVEIADWWLTVYEELLESKRAEIAGLKEDIDAKTSQGDEGYLQAIDDALAILNN